MENSDLIYQLINTRLAIENLLYQLEINNTRNLRNYSLYNSYYNPDLYYPLYSSYTNSYSNTDLFNSLSNNLTNPTNSTNSTNSSNSTYLRNRFSRARSYPYNTSTNNTSVNRTSTNRTSTDRTFGNNNINMDGINNLIEASRIEGKI